MGMGAETAVPIAINVLLTVIPFLKCLCRNNTEIGVALVKRGGLTTLCNSVEHKSKFGCVIIDIDEMVQSSLTDTDRNKIEAYKQAGDVNAIRNMLLPMYREARAEYRKNYSGKKIIVISHDVNLLNHMGINNKRIFAFLPSKLLLEDIIAQSPDDDTRHLIQSQKNEILQCKYPIITYESFNALAVLFSNKFGLKLKND
jgi:hypothetical protein